MLTNGLVCGLIINTPLFLLWVELALATLMEIKMSNICDWCEVSSDLIHDELRFEHRQNVGDSNVCYDCLAADIMYRWDWRVPHTISSEQYKKRKADLLTNLRHVGHEDYSDQAEDPYDDRDRL